MAEDGDKPEGESVDDEGLDAILEAVSDESTDAATKRETMTTKKPTKKATKANGATKVRKVKASGMAAKTKTAKKTRKVKSSGEGRVTLVYSLKDGIPDHIKASSAAGLILYAIKKRGEATKNELAEDLGRKFPDPTLRFNLWKLSTAKILSAK